MYTNFATGTAAQPLVVVVLVVVPACRLYKVLYYSLCPLSITIIYLQYTCRIKLY